MSFFSDKTVTLKLFKPMLKHRGKDIDSSKAKYMVKVCRTRLDPVEMVSILSTNHGDTDFQVLKKLVVRSRTPSIGVKVSRQLESVSSKCH